MCTLGNRKSSSIYGTGLKPLHKLLEFCVQFCKQALPVLIAMDHSNLTEGNFPMSGRVASRGLLEKEEQSLNSAIQRHWTVHNQGEA